MPLAVSECRVLLLLDTLTTARAVDSSVVYEFDTPEARTAYAEEERRLLEEKVKLVCRSGVTVLLVAGAVDALALELLAGRGVFVLRNVHKV